ncbi:hypothetical protein CBM2631_A90307 [Cupriavidus taiwanensis]|nr:hypothetical protein CBM2631_A90307 [Cupriavidus taiwanensis]
MREWGWTMPILIDEQDNVIAGHGRLLAATRLGFDEAPVMVARGWSEAQKRAYMLADNKLALNASWDDALLTVELGDLKGLGFDLDLIGFSDSEQNAILSGWMGDASDVAAAGDSVAGTDRRIVVGVPMEQGDRAYKIIGEALEGEGIEYVFRT